MSTSATDYLPRRLGPLPTLADTAAIHELVRRVIDNEPIAAEQLRLLAPGVTMGGARPKALYLTSSLFKRGLLELVERMDVEWRYVPYDGAFAPDILAALRQRGYLVEPHPWPLGDVQLIVRTLTGWDAASDPRGRGEVRLLP